MNKVYPDHWSFMLGEIALPPHRQLEAVGQRPHPVAAGRQVTRLGGKRRSRLRRRDRCRRGRCGHDVLTAELDLAGSIARPWTFEKDPCGTLGPVADATTQRLVGAYAVAPLASEWIHQAAQAIRTHIRLEVLLDGVAQFPTYSEAYLQALENLKP